MENTVLIQFHVSKEEKQLLSQLAERNGRASVAATLRRLINDEAFRQNIDSSAQNLSSETR